MISPLAPLLAALAFFPGRPASAQELEPRTYRTLPTGLNFLVLTYSLSTGNVLTDPTAPIESLSADLEMFSVSYLRSRALFGPPASLMVSVPYAELGGSAGRGGQLVTGSRAEPRG